MPMPEEEKKPSLLDYLTHPVSTISNQLTQGAANTDWRNVAKSAANTALSPTMVDAALPAPINSGNLWKNLFQADASKPPQTINQDGKQYSFTPGQNGSLTAPAPTNNAPLVPESQNVAKVLPGMPPSVSPDEIAGLLNPQKQALNRFGPDAELNLQKDLNARRDSFGYKAADAGKGFADALMQGVAGAGNPGWQNQFEAQENQFDQNQTNALHNAGTANARNVEGRVTLDKMDPNSVSSRAAQASWAPLFVEKLGYKPESLKNMSAAEIDNHLALMTQFKGDELKAANEKMQMGIDSKKLDAMMQNQESEDEKRKSDIDIEQQKLKQENRENLGKMSWISRKLHPDIAQAYKEGAGLAEDEITPDVRKYAGQHGLTPQQALNVKKARGG